MSLTAGLSFEDVDPVSGRPFRSILRPHLAFIEHQRRLDKSWQEIANLLRAQHGVVITGRGVNRYFAAVRKRKTWPLGMEPLLETSPGVGVHETTPEPGGVLGGKRGRKEEVADQPDRFRSRLFPHLASIEARRAAGDSWRQIAEALAERGITISHQAVSNFYKRTRARVTRRVAETAGSQLDHSAMNPPATRDPASSRNRFPDEEDYMSQMNRP